MGAPRIWRVNSETRVYCLIGGRASRSASPSVLNSAFRELGLDCVYVSFDVPKGDLSAAVAGIRALGIEGANVTTPHKTEAVRLLDGLSAEADAAQAVNVIKNASGKLRGFNTDGEGAVKALERVTDVNGGKAVVIGAGGAGRAIALALAKRAADVALANRSFEKAEAAARRFEELGVRVRPLPLNPPVLREELRDADVLVNATTLGSPPLEDVSPVPPGALRPGLTVLDAVYNPLKTRLLRQAESAGCRVVDGVWMLVYQAAEALRIWAGVSDPPLRVMRQAALDWVVGG
ncbi:MAG: shikimate dehydrogenase [Candidatus Korarchaeota archaeon]|nr:shikimate dehydrogenase [Candidatus Korarchaeota archaeon]